MDQNDNPNILKYKIDRYHAATFNLETIPTDPLQFDNMLKETMGHLTTAKVKGVWLQLNLDKCALIPIAIKHGFRYHHTKKEYVLLAYWIPKDEPSKLPHYASNFIGVGGVVINEETDEVLLIQEQHSYAENLWKIPGGLVDDSEYISQAVEREVFEETRIKAQFQSLICFRELLEYNWGASDTYFVCVLKALTYEIKIDPSEIKAAQWMKIDEYIKLQNMYELHKKIAQVVALRKLKGKSSLKELGSDVLNDCAGYTAEQYITKYGDKITLKNTFYSPAIAKKLASLGNE